MGEFWFGFLRVEDLRMVVCWGIGGGGLLWCKAGLVWEMGRCEEGGVGK